MKMAIKLRCMVSECSGTDQNPAWKVHFAQVAHQRKAVQARHAMIGDQQLETRDPFDCLGKRFHAITGKLDMVTGAGKGIKEKPSDRRVCPAVTQTRAAPLLPAPSRRYQHAKTERRLIYFLKKTLRKGRAMRPAGGI